MLAIAESLCIAKGLDWAFCDTDSMAIAKPDGMDQAEFFERAQSICDWFSPLNPYEKKGSIFKIEDANYPIAESADGLKFEPLYCYCISAKRYVLFNRGPTGEIIIRKASAHGLGQYLPPYEADDAPSSIPTPSVPLNDIGVERWQYDLWYMIIRAALDGHPDQVDLSYHDALKRPAVSRYGATTPALLKWFDSVQCRARVPGAGEAVQFPECLSCPAAIRIAGCGAMGKAEPRPTKEAIGREAGLAVQ